MKHVSFKVTDFDPNRIKRSMFETKKAYEYFLIGFYASRDLQIHKDLGYIIIDDGEPLDRHYNFYISFDEEDGKLSMPRVGPYFNGGMTMWLGAIMGNLPNTVFVYKKELDDAFSNLELLPPETAQKFVVRGLDHYLGN